MPGLLSLGLLLAALAPPVGAVASPAPLEAHFPEFAAATLAVGDDWRALVPWHGEAFEGQARDAPAGLARVLQATGSGPASEAAGPALASTLVLRFDDLRTLDIEGDLDVRRHEVGGFLVDAHELRQGHRMARALSEDAAQAYERDLERHLRDLVEATLVRAFPDAARHDVTELSIDPATLRHDATGGVLVRVAARVDEPIALPADPALAGLAAFALVLGLARARRA